MRPPAFKTTVPLLFVCLLPQPALFGQKPAGPNVEHTFHLANTPSATDFQEIATVLRTVAMIRTLSVDPGASSISISGTPADIAMAEWTINALDQPATPDAANKQIRATALNEYRVPGAKDDVVRMFYLANITTPQAMQELLTVLRTVGRIDYIFTYTPLHAVAVRGSTNQVALSAWMISEMDQPPTVQRDGIHQFQSSDPAYPVVRAFYLVSRRTRDLQETLTAVRSSAHIQRAFAHSSRAVLILAGSPEQVEEAARLIAAKDRPATP
jgi:type II secretory pathway component GspD/PulD (secretin)